MRKIERSIEIPASPDVVWQVLTDTDAYEAWNPFMTELTGELRAGERLSVTIRPGKRTMTFRPTISAVEPGRSVVWRGRAGVPGLFDGTHELHVGPAPTGTRFVHREVFSGILVPLMRGLLDDTETGFEAMNEALADRVADVSRPPAVSS